MVFLVEDNLQDVDLAIDLSCLDVGFTGKRVDTSFEYFARPMRPEEECRAYLKIGDLVLNKDFQVFFRRDGLLNLGSLPEIVSHTMKIVVNPEVFRSLFIKALLLNDWNHCDPKLFGIKLPDVAPHYIKMASIMRDLQKLARMWTSFLVKEKTEEVRLISIYHQLYEMYEIPYGTSTESLLDYFGIVLTPVEFGRVVLFANQMLSIVEGGEPE